MTGGADPTEFRVTVIRGHGHTVVRLAGELDFASTGQLADAITDLMSSAPPTVVTVDVEQLEFADVAGLHPLFDLAEQMEPGTVQVHGARRAVARIFQVLDRTDLLG